MGRIIVSEFVSLDGVMEGPGPDDSYAHAGWTFEFQDPGGMQYKLDEVMAHDALLLGVSPTRDSLRHGRGAPTRSASPTR